MNRDRLTAALDTLLAFAWLARTTVLFRLRGRAAVARATEQAMSIRPTPLAEIGMQPDAGWRTHRAVLRAKRAWPFEARCLQTALTMQAVLKHHRLDAPVRVGVRAEDGELRAHAWVELANGHMLDDGPGGRDFELLPATRASAPDTPREGSAR